MKDARRLDLDKLDKLRDQPMQLNPPFRRPLTYEDCEYIHSLFNGGPRNPNLCISKGQYKDVCEKLLAQNHMLQKRVAQLENTLLETKNILSSNNTAIVDTIWYGEHAETLVDFITSILDGTR